MGYCRMTVDIIFRVDRVVKAYMEGMNWVLHYYFQGVSIKLNVGKHHRRC